MKRILLILSLFFILNEVQSQAIQTGSGTQENTITQASPVNTYFRRQVAHLFIHVRN